MSETDAVRALQEKLLEACSDTPISERTRQAFLDTPRHWFVPRYQGDTDKAWHEVTAENLVQHLPALYADEPVLLASEGGRMLSTISQPQIVLQMLELLGAQPQWITRATDSQFVWSLSR